MEWSLVVGGSHLFCKWCVSVWWVWVCLRACMPLCFCFSRVCVHACGVCVIEDAASKHAAQAFFDCLRAEVEEYGVSVSTISHTFINATTPEPEAKGPAKPVGGLAACTYEGPHVRAHRPSGSRNTLTSCLFLLPPAVIASKLTHGVSPSALANEIVRTVNRKRKEVLLAHPIPRVALHLRSLFPPFLFSVLAAGVKDSVMAEQM